MKKNRVDSISSALSNSSISLDDHANSQIKKKRNRRNSNKSTNSKSNIFSNKPLDVNVKQLKQCGEMITCMKKKGWIVILKKLIDGVSESMRRDALKNILVGNTEKEINGINSFDKIRESIPHVIVFIKHLDNSITREYMIDSVYDAMEWS